MINILRRAPDTGKEGEGGKENIVSSNLSTALSFIPKLGGASDGVISKMQAIFVDGYMIENPFIEWSQDAQSVDFVKEYYRFCAGDPAYRNYGFEIETTTEHNWPSITKEGVEAICQQLGISNFSSLPVATYFKQDGKKVHPTHDLICQMWFLTDSEHHYPFYLAAGHIGKSEHHKDRFMHYANKIFPAMMPDEITPNREGLAGVLMCISTIVEKSNKRLHDIEIPLEELAPLMREKGLAPFELYENLMREELRMVNNITTGETIGFKLTPIGAMFLYMCNPRD